MKNLRKLSVAMVMMIGIILLGTSGCKGEKGQDGDPGAKGDQGVTGPKGDPGSTDHGALTGLGDNDHPQYQMRVTGTCGSGNAIRVINSNGTVTCEPVVVAGGTLTDVLAGGGLSRIRNSGVVTLSVPNLGITDAMLQGSISPSKITGTAWTSLNDGSGSGLDADMVDGQHGPFLNSEADTLDSVVARNPRTARVVYIDDSLEVKRTATSGYAIYANSADTAGGPGCVNCGAIRAQATLGQGGYISTADPTEYGLRVRNPNGSTYPGLRVDGTLMVTGNVSKGGGSFLIDHPLDPKNKVLRHSFVESPDMMNIYKGRAWLTGGVAVIELPDYFDALNKAEGREIYLTPINGWSPLYMDGDIIGNYVIVMTTPEGNPNQEFSWVVLGVRKDPYAQNNPIVVEEEKGANNDFPKGECIHPEACQ